MKTVELDEDVYLHIAKQTTEIGESASSILRRLLAVGSAVRTEAVHTTTLEHELANFLQHPMFGTSTTAVSRMLMTFKEVHRQHEKDFDKVLSIQGRHRAYFAKSKQEILKSGTSTQPREIGGTGYWVMTNSPNQQKQQMVREVLSLFGYSKKAIDAASAAIK